MKKVHLKTLILIIACSVAFLSLLIPFLNSSSLTHSLNLIHSKSAVPPTFPKLEHLPQHTLQSLTPIAKNNDVAVDGEQSGYISINGHTPDLQKPETAWAIQVANFNDLENANKLMVTLQKENLPAFVSQKNNTQFLVLIGPYPDQTLAKETQETIKKVVKDSVFLVKYAPIE